MKILVAVIGTNSTTLFKKTLSWAPRGGFNMRVFISEAEPKEDYLLAIDNANHEHYLDMPPAVIIQGETPKAFAKKEGYDLLVTLADDMTSWHLGMQRDKMIIEYAVDLGKARVEFNADSSKTEHLFPNGSMMVRL